MPVAVLRQIAKTLGRSHELAEALWQSGHYEARLLATFMAEPARVTAPQMDGWFRDNSGWPRAAALGRERRLARAEERERATPAHGAHPKSVNRPLPSVLLLALGVSCSAASWNRLTGETYELDTVSRDAQAPCRPELLRVYRGERVRLEPPITVAAPFEPRVARFEVLVAEVGIRVYGRAPTRILNAGAYACRAVAHRNERLSEHALGNALDVTGFRFPALARDTPGGGAENVALGLPRALESAFIISIARDYPDASARTDAVSLRHRLFFEALASGLRQADIFRGMLGPSDPRHGTHLHLDMGPWSYERL